MADPRFFDRKGPYSLAELARICGAEIQGPGEGSISDVAPLSSAGPGEISFLDNKAYLGDLGATRAGAVILRPVHADKAPDGVVPLFSDQPYKAYALVARAFYPPNHVDMAGISVGAHVADSARVGAGCQVDAGAVVEAGAEIGPRCRIAANAVIGRNVVLGEDSYIGPGATLTFCHVGARAVVHAGVRIGQDGFGFAQGPEGHLKVPQLGRVLISDDVEIGANTTIDRGAGPDTIIGPGCIIDNLVQIGHNVRLGRGCTIVSQTGISGSTTLEEFVVLAGKVGVSGHLTIGKGAIVAATSGVIKSLPGGQIYGGAPAIPAREWRRQLAAIALLGKGKLRQRDG